MHRQALIKENISKRHSGRHRLSVLGTEAGRGVSQHHSFQLCKATPMAWDSPLGLASIFNCLTS